MEYDIKLVNVEKEEMERKHWATVVYKFRISNGSANIHGDVVLTEGGVNIIEKNGRDPDSVEASSVQILSAVRHQRLEGIVGNRVGWPFFNSNREKPPVHFSGYRHPGCAGSTLVLPG
jgi:hypothetical protein